MMNQKKHKITLDIYIKGTTDQQLKGLLLKLRNEIRKGETNWDDIKIILRKIFNYDSEILNTIVPLILLEE